MKATDWLGWRVVAALSLIACVVTVAVEVVVAQPPRKFGGTYADLDPRRQALVADWVARFVRTTGQALEPGPFYDDILTLSTKTTFDAVTHALMTTRLTDGGGADLGDALALVEQVESVRGEVAGAPGDRQFRLYVRLTEDAADILGRSQQFRRAGDNAVYHKGYPINFRGQGGVPSVQVSIARDRRRADVDVDYRSPSFPNGLFNGHLTASNSDVRAGNNYDRHLNRWTGFESWWRSLFGVRTTRADEAVPESSPLALPTTPRAGQRSIDVMVEDFLTAWLVEGDVVAAMGYVSERAYACLAQDLDDPSTLDRGLAPFKLMVDLKTARDALDTPPAALADVIVGTRLTAPALKVVTQPHHAQFVIYAVPDDVAAAFDCESRLSLGDPGRARRDYGTYYGATFYLQRETHYPVALLWARVGGFWKIVSWQIGSNEATGPAAEPVAVPAIARVKADPSLARAARDFVENWLVRKDTDAAFRAVAPSAYACYDLERGPAEPPSTSPEDAGAKLQASLARSGTALGTSARLDAVMSPADPVHPALRLMTHRDDRIYTLASVPDALADAAECAAQVRGDAIADPLPLEYGNAVAMMMRFKTRSGDAPVLRLLWRRLDGTWRITAYGVEHP